MAGKRIKQRKRLDLRSILFVLVLLAVFGGATAAALRGGGERPADETLPPVKDPVVDGHVTTPPEGTQAEPFDMAYTLGMGESDYTLTAGQKALIGELMSAWYTDIGTFNENPSYEHFFEKDEDDDAHRHEAAIRTLVAIRKRALEDLRLRRCDTTLTVTGIESRDDGRIRIELTEDSVMRFAGLDVDSYLYDMPHVFYMKDRGDDTWIFTYHEADDNPFFTYTYEEGNPYDKNHAAILAAIDARHAALDDDVAVVTKDCHHPYDRTAAETYMREYCDKRNGDWYAYDDVGGNCMNYGSQVLLSGGIPMDTADSAQWYWRDMNRLSLSFINVGRFYDYARDNTGYGLVAAVDAPYSTGEVGDVLIFGDAEVPLSHTTVISGVVEKEGKVIDYLLCSNTTNYRDFPAGAYYYTEHTLVKIFGYNDN